MKKLILRSVWLKGHKVYPWGTVRKYSTMDERIQQRIRDHLSPPQAPKPPYPHVCQVGDPVLRLQAEPVEEPIIITAVFKQFVNNMITVMRKFNSYGISAPQIGVSSQVFVVETTPQAFNEAMRRPTTHQPMDVVPLRVFVNPRVKILDFTTTNYPESCSSICGYIANVPRARKIEIHALDLEAKPFVWQAEGWAAKLVQHEMDHLQGVVFTDKMDPKTFSCAVWDQINRKQGRMSIDFFPQKKNFFHKMFFH